MEVPAPPAMRHMSGRPPYRMPMVSTVQGKGLRSSTFRLDVSTICGASLVISVYQNGSG